MKTLFSLLIVLLTLSLSAKEHHNSETPFLNANPMIQRLGSQVNPITGELCLEEVDMVVAGSEPVSLRRFYSHRSNYDPRYATWRYNPEYFCAANFELGKHEKRFIAVGNFDGAVTSLQNISGPSCTFDLSRNRAYTFMPNGNIVVCEHTPWKSNDIYPLPYLLYQIKTYNADKSVLLGEIIL